MSFALNGGFMACAWRRLSRRVGVIPRKCKAGIAGDGVARFLPSQLRELALRVPRSYVARQVSSIGIPYGVQCIPPASAPSAYHL
jgi:hypothetical protein